MLLIILVALIIFIPSSEIVITIFNSVLSNIFKPTILPKLELKDGITEALSTMVIMPTLLTNEKRVKDLLEQLEVFFLGNRDNNLYFALVGDFRDSDVQYEKGDNDIVDAALKGIGELNARYGNGSREIFFLSPTAKKIQWFPRKVDGLGKKKRGDN